MLSHVNIGTNDFAKSLPFYSAVLTELGHRLRFHEEGVWAGWQQQTGGRPLFIVARPFDGKAASVGNGQMIALLAGDRATVDRCHATALANGGSCEGPPGLRPHYHDNYYGAYVRDPEGNKLCVCCHEAEDG
ncbi:VOC family protein [Bosea caraganae]|uniref:VOC family protein n=1 Tax=Bosea caraganae TaxID=2763117 RepID=A0A370LBB9_9HYPH|nr:VOC family protein [Bosea caraganae]RDJ27113.1 VOC family protein [Bosea caraganae]RDJ29130.1 VOC family protein [Bosea caraganae]